MRIFRLDRFNEGAGPEVDTRTTCWVHCRPLGKRKWEVEEGKWQKLVWQQVVEVCMN